MIGTIPTSQFLSALIVPLSIVMMVRLGHREAPEATPPAKSRQKRGA